MTLGTVTVGRIPLPQITLERLTLWQNDHQPNRGRLSIVLQSDCVAPLSDIRLNVVLLTAEAVWASHPEGPRTNGS